MSVAKHEGPPMTDPLCRCGHPKDIHFFGPCSYVPDTPYGPDKCTCRCYTPAPEPNVAGTIIDDGKNLVRGDPNMSEETLGALTRMADLAAKQFGGDES